MEAIPCQAKLITSEAVLSIPLRITIGGFTGEKTITIPLSELEVMAEAKKDSSAWWGCKRDRLPVGTVAYPIDLR